MRARHAGWYERNTVAGMNLGTIRRHRLAVDEHHLDVIARNVEPVEQGTSGYRLLNRARHRIRPPACAEEFGEPHEGMEFYGLGASDTFRCLRAPGIGNPAIV